MEVGGIGGVGGGVDERRALCVDGDVQQLEEDL